MGGHCICIVGCDDVQGCWICKNSWGTQWGDPNDPGWFKIAYGVCGIFRAYAGYGYSLSITPPPGQTGIQINTAGSLKADIVVKGVVIGQQTNSSRCPLAATRRPSSRRATRIIP